MDYLADFELIRPWLIVLGDLETMDAMEGKIFALINGS